MFLIRACKPYTQTNYGSPSWNQACIHAYIYLDVCFMHMYIYTRVCAYIPCMSRNLLPQSDGPHESPQFCQICACMYVWRMYVCMYVCMYVFKYPHVHHLRFSKCVYVHMYGCMYVCYVLFMYVFRYAYIACIHTHMHPCIHARTYMRRCMYAHTWMHAHTSSMYAHTNVYIYT